MIVQVVHIVCVSDTAYATPMYRRSSLCSSCYLLTPTQYMAQIMASVGGSVIAVVLVC